jgi:hypothetical protein
MGAALYENRHMLVLRLSAGISILTEISKFNFIFAQKAYARRRLVSTLIPLGGVFCEY